MELRQKMGDMGYFGTMLSKNLEANAGYLNNPEATAQAWRNGWFHTSDAFIVDDTGNYYFIDRLRRLVFTLFALAVAARALYDDALHLKA